MELLVERKWPKATYTIGRLYVDGEYLCNTLEDKDRGLTQSMSTVEIYKKKTYGQTAIPRGRYRVDMDTISQKFRFRIWAQPYDGKLPRLLDVPGFAGVLVHVGNSPQDTQGCILCGRNTVKGRLTDSTKCFRKLMDDYLIPAHKRKEEIWITIN